MEDWYRVTPSQIISITSNARTLLQNVYGNSLYKALQAVYPEHYFEPWRFKSMSTMQASAHFNSPLLNHSPGSMTMDDVASKKGHTSIVLTENEIRVLQRLEMEVVHIRDKSPSELQKWYSITAEQIKQCGGEVLLNRHNFIEVLQSYYGSVYEFLPWMFSNVRSSSHQCKKLVLTLSFISSLQSPTIGR